jgi:tRNA threonylcarbamoyladenosine modification (KEOPS) complex Cgi121 subunit
MSSEETAMEVATNFYEEKDVEKFLAEAKEKGVTVRVHEEKKDEFVDYVVGGVVHAIRFAKPGKRVAVTLRPIA